MLWSLTWSPRTPCLRHCQALHPRALRHGQGTSALDMCPPPLSSAGALAPMLTGFHRQAVGQNQPAPALKLTPRTHLQFCVRGCTGLRLLRPANPERLKKVSRCVAATNAPNMKMIESMLASNVGRSVPPPKPIPGTELAVVDSGAQPNVANGPVDFPAHSIRESPGQRDGVRYKRAHGPFPVGPLKNSPNNISNLTRARGSPARPCQVWMLSVLGACAI